MSCTTKHPLVRDGVSQNQRMVEALKPSYAKVDDRSLFDLLFFIAEYSKGINFFNLENKIDGHWNQLFESDITVIFSEIINQDIQKITDCYTAILKQIQDPLLNEMTIHEMFYALFCFLFTLLVKFDKWYKQTSGELEIYGFLKQQISIQLKPVLEQLAGFYKGAIDDPSIFNLKYNFSKSIFGYSLDDIEKIVEKDFTEEWWIDPLDPKKYSDWKSFYKKIATNKTIYGPQRDDISIESSVKIRYCLDEFQVVFDAILKAFKQLVKQGPSLAIETLTKVSSHEPHSGLLLSFLKIFKHAQNHINTITERHLEFYYEEVLRLLRLEAVPDKAEVIVELAKHTDSYEIAKGTLFKAGKDALGKEVLYQSDCEKVVNKATVACLRSVYIDKKNMCRISASPFANSSDGNGTAFLEKEPKWKAFGESQVGKKPIQKTMPDAEVGFAVTSPLLILNDGTRTIHLKFTFDSAIALKKEIISELFNFSFTGPKGWITKKDETELDFEAKVVKNTCEILLKLKSGAVACVGYEKKIHGGIYETPFPILKLTANPLSKDNYLYQVFQSIQFEGIGLKVDVFNVKDVLVQNDFGVLKATKPFQPFGSVPAIGSTFYIGSNEVFKKSLDSLVVGLKWHKLPVTGGTESQPDCNFNQHYNYNILPDEEDPYYSYDPSNYQFKATFEILKDGTWTEIKSSTSVNGELFENNAFNPKSIWFNKSNLPITTNTSQPKFTEYTVDVKQGFLRMVLRAPKDLFGHKIFTPLLTKQAIKRKDDLPVEPYTPEISSITLTYSASEKIDLTNPKKFDQRTSKLYHVFPFGIQEIYKKTSSDKMYLLPQFLHEEKKKEIKHHGEFIIGISDLKPPQNFSVLFKVAEGSSLPGEKKQPVFWFYLSKNKWVAFETNEIVSDGTNGLLTSGIIEFNIPHSITNTNTILESGYYWIKAAVKNNPDSVCDMMAVKAQAVPVSFSDNKNDPNFLLTPTINGSISKLKDKKSEIKSVSQPYASHGGTPSERDEGYYQRVSERLRHKNRGISVWDYEHLVLQNFPEVYKVKCISHSVYDVKNNLNELEHSEFEPGYVTLVAVPQLKNVNAINPLEPCLSLNVLDSIRKFLITKISPFAVNNLQVLNPLFEKIQIQCFVQLYDGLDEGYYKALLVEDIKKFLSPWAYDDSQDIVFGGELHKTIVLNFVEELPYVDYVTDFIMNHVVDENLVFTNIGKAVATSARSVLVSHISHIILEKSSCT